MGERFHNRRRIIATIIVAFVAILVLCVFISYRNKSTLTIVNNVTSSTVSVFRENQQEQVAESSDPVLRLRLSSGDYWVEVVGSGVMQKQVVAMDGDQDLSITFDAYASMNTQLVGEAKAIGLSGAGGSLAYLDMDERVEVELSATQPYLRKGFSAIDSPRRLLMIVPGLYLIADDEGAAYQLVGDTKHQVTTNGGSPVIFNDASYDAATDTLSILSSGNVYNLGGIAASFASAQPSPVATLLSPVPSAAAGITSGGGKIFVYGNNDDDFYENTEVESLLFSNGDISARLAKPIYIAAVSPDGGFVFCGSASGESWLLSTDDLSIVRTIPATNISDLYWQSSDSLIIANYEGLWQYIPSINQLRLLDEGTYVDVGSDGQNLYAATSGEQPALYRLTTDTVEDSGWWSLVPYYRSDYWIQMYVFGGNTVFEITPIATASHAWQLPYLDQQLSVNVQSAKTWLQQQGVDFNQVMIVETY